MKLERKVAEKFDLEVGLCSVGRMRILRELIRKPEQLFTKYQLERLTHLKPVDTRRDLKVLIQLGWVKEHQYCPKKYSINFDNEIVKHIAEFFYKVGYRTKK